MSFLNVLNGLAKLSTEASARFLPGVTQMELLDSTSADATPSTILNSRVVAVDSDGIVKFDYKDDQGNTTTEVRYMAKGTWYHYRNVSKVYRYYTGTTAITTTVYNSAGSAVTGLKLYR